ncbi:LPS glycosyltransferase [Psychrobacter aquaticus]|uniref:Putative lipopolysaccharide glycosyltransferase n=1 Tax=Psychrobacter aquaticus CMS 56 TaxID=1354303 RepID=U4T885_9GAMM|nr:LPS glycosyltransferase [Psychrobacter aquaticus]ERL54683.1 putative lipopolysaccharide glycosyltransferase [Psychrobacter aquaticus CMS 56]
MVLNLRLPSTVEFDIETQIISINAFNANETEQHLHKKSVNIIASGPSIARVDFAALQDTPTIFVNGSISLTEQHHFTDIAGYVISDAQFINHQPEILKRHYTGQPLYATLAVFEAMARTHPDIMRTYHYAMRVLYPVDRPWGVKSNKLFFSKLMLKKKFLNKKKPLSYFINHPYFIVEDSHKFAHIGVSLNITYGFVEAGTVAYVAAQLAFSRHAATIHLYGIDLLNSDQPRFYEHKNNSAPSTLNTVISDRIVPSFNLLSKVYKEHGVCVINHSPISKALFENL